MAGRALPVSFQKLVVKKLTPVFKEAVDIITQSVTPPGTKEILIRNKYVGINASDVNMAAGRYFSKNLTLPFDIGFEAVGEVADFGEEVKDFKRGQPVMYMGMNAFAEYVYIPENEVIPITSLKPEFLPLMVSGTTAGLSLDKLGHIVPGEKVLITAAAGGAGHIAVQWAKNAGCHVIGTCSTEDKVEFLKDIGCDRPINYKKESLEEVLKSEYPNGIDVIWETVGGSVFELLFRHLAVKGRLVVVGAISGYLQQQESSAVKDMHIPMKLLLQSSTLSGFLLTHYKSDIPHYLTLLVRQLHEQTLRIQVDDGSSQGKSFKGLQDISKAIDYLYSGKSKGKIVVAL